MLIGLHGRATCGKDTIYQIIQDEFGGGHLRVVRDAFADGLKLSAYRCFEPESTLEEAYAWFETLKRDGSIYAEDASNTLIAEASGRDFLEQYGEGHRNTFGEDFWLDQVLPCWRDDDYGRNDGLTRDDILIVTDVRRVIEAERILDCGGSVWKVTRPGVEERTSEPPLPSDYISYTIDNRTSIDALRSKTLLGVWNELAQQTPA